MRRLNPCFQFKLFSMECLGQVRVHKSVAHNNGQFIVPLEKTKLIKY